MNFLPLSSLALAATLAVSSNVHAASMDTFDFGDTSTGDALVATNTGSNTNSVSDVSIFAGYHTVTASRVSGTGNVESRINWADSGFFSLDIDDNFTQGSATLTLDANGSGLGGIDLTSVFGSDDQFAIGLVGLVGVVDLSVTLVDTFAGTDTVSTGGLFGIGTQNILFSSFAGVDITSIDSIALTLSSIQAGTDADIEFFGTSDSTPPSSVPLPASAALLGLGLIGLRRRLTRG